MKNRLCILLLITFFSIHSFGQKQDTTIYLAAEVFPAFKYANSINTREACKKYFMANFKMPEELRDNCYSGNIFVEFVVERDSSLSNVKLIREMGGLIDTLVLEAVKAMPNWSPARNKGKIVRCSYIIPVLINWLYGEIENKDKLIESSSVDSINIGMTINEFLNITRVKSNITVRKEKINLEGDDYDIYNVYKYDKIIYAVEPDEEKVWRIWIHSEELKTKKGIGIGNTLGDLRKNYTVNDFATGEGSVAILIKELNVSFLLDVSMIPKSWWVNQTLDGLNDDILIDLIIVT